MNTLTREQYLKEFRRKAQKVNSSRETAISFYNKIGILTPTGRVSKNYKHVPSKSSSKPTKPTRK